MRQSLLSFSFLVVIAILSASAVGTSQTFWAEHVTSGE